MCNQTRDVYPVSAADLTDTNEMVQNQRSYSAHGPLVSVFLFYFWLIYIFSNGLYFYIGQHRF